MKLKLLKKKETINSIFLNVFKIYCGFVWEWLELNLVFFRCSKCSSVFPSLEFGPFPVNGVLLLIREVIKMFIKPLQKHGFDYTLELVNNNNLVETTTFVDATL